jgi:hypothetical protein
MMLYNYLKGRNVSFPFIEKEVLTMSLADFDDIYRLCSDFNKEGVYEGVTMMRLNQLTSNSLTYPNNFTLDALGEIEEKRAEVLV